jgi:hypothetical protein
VGGFDSQNKHQGQPGAVFTPVAASRQREAVRYLSASLFKTPEWLLDPTVLTRLAPDSGTQRLLAAQRSVLRTLLDRGRTERLQEQETLLGDKAYRLTELLANLRSGIFTELEGGGARIAPLRRNLQRAYLELLDDRLNRPAPTLPPQLAAFISLPTPLPDDTRGAVRAELKAILALAGRPVADKATKAHLEDLRDQITRMLDPKLASSGTSVLSGMFANGEQEQGCWPAYGQEGLR